MHSVRGWRVEGLIRDLSTKVLDGRCWADDEAFMDLVLAMPTCIYLQSLCVCVCIYMLTPPPKTYREVLRLRR